MAMAETRDRLAQEPASQAEPKPAQDDNSLEAASEDATRELEKRRDGGGYGGFGDIG